MGENRDFKYVIIDSMKVYIGAKYEMDELEEDVRIPVKFIVFIRKVIPIDKQEGLAIDTYLYGLEENTMEYLLWKQLGISMKFQNLYSTKKRGKEIYETQILSFDEGIKQMKDDPNKQNCFLVEIQFSKIKLTMLGV